MRADLDKDVEPIAGHGVDGRGKSHRLAHVAAEVGGVERSAGGERAGHGRVDRQRGCLGRAAPPARRPAAPGRAPSARCGTRSSPAACWWPTPRAASSVRASCKRGGLARQHDAARAVDRRDTEPIAEGRRQLGGLRGRQADRGHATTAGRLLHDAAALPDHTNRIGQASARPPTCSAAISPTLWPTTASGRMPHDCHSAASAACSANSAGWATSVWPSRDRASSAVSSSSSDQPASGRSNASHRVITSRKTGSLGQQLAAHREPLRALAAEDERDARARHRPAGCGAAIVSRCRQLVDARPPVVRGPTPTTAARDGRCAAALRGGEGDVHRRGRRWCRESRAKPPAGPAAPAGSAPTAAAARLIGGGLVGGAGQARRLLDDDVGVGAADAERADAGATRLRRPWPRLQRGRRWRAACRRARCAG